MDRNSSNRSSRSYNSRGSNNNENQNANGLGLSQADLMAIATIVATTLQGLVTNNNAGNQAPPPPPPPQRGVKYHYESLRKNRCPTFDGSTDPEVGQNWLKNVETQLRLLEIPEALKVDKWSQNDSTSKKRKVIDENEKPEEDRLMIDKKIIRKVEKPEEGTSMVKKERTSSKNDQQIKSLRKGEKIVLEGCF